MALAIS